MEQWIYLRSYIEGLASHMTLHGLCQNPQQIDCMENIMCTCNYCGYLLSIVHRSKEINKVLGLEL